MRRVSDVLHALESIAPAQYAFSWDRIGMQVGDRNAEVSKAVVSLDRSLAAIRHAAGEGAQLLLAHHPLIWDPLKSIDAATYDGRSVLELIQARITFVAAHTNWDVAPGGINDVLAARLGLEDVDSFGSYAPVRRLQLVTFCPEEAVAGLIDALSEAGAGVIGLYRRCAFTSPGQGTFTPSEGANPAIGKIGQTETVDETRIEMVLPEARADAVTQALFDAHPYEEPAFNLHMLHSPKEQPAGRVGTLPEAMPFEQFVSSVDHALGTRSLAWGPSGMVRRVAVVGGAADEEWRAAAAAGADLFVTGEVRHHVAVEASDSGFRIIQAGHFATEHPGCAELRTRMSDALPEIKWLLYTPEPGTAGRPLLEKNGSPDGT